MGAFRTLDVTQAAGPAMPMPRNANGKIMTSERNCGFTEEAKST